MTRTERQFRRSLYLSLGWACACLGYAEYPFIPEMAVLTAVVGALLVVAYRAEGRWALSVWAANALGAVIGLAAVGWVAVQFYRPSWGNSLLDVLPWPTSLLPFLGPLLMVLIPAKLFRPKHTGDYWGLLGIGAMAVALACAMAGDGIFGLLMFGYLVVTTGSLTLFYLYRGELSAAGDFTVCRPPRRQPLWLAGRWSVLVSVLAVALFLATPRGGDARWELTAAAGKLTGISDERPTIDLNLSGELKINAEVAFEVTVESAEGSPKLDLPGDQLWRHTSFDFYVKGRWDRSDRAIGGPRGDSDGRRNFGYRSRDAQPPGDLPYLGPNQYTLTYRQAAKPTLNYFAAYPIWIGPAFAGRRFEAPVRTEQDFGRTIGWGATPEGDLFPREPFVLPGSGRHRQVTKPATEPGLSPPLPIDAAYAKTATRQYSFLSGLATLRQYTQGLVKMLVELEKLPAEVYRDDDPGLVAPVRCHEQLARVFSDYLKYEGNFRYTLKSSRSGHGQDLDPVEDFLLFTRKGYCTRFATALSLMLRARGVPARIVMGYMGQEWAGDGNFIVRQNMAHSWVEVLIQRPVASGEPIWHWLVLDPTPAVEAAEDRESRLSRWFDDLQRNTSKFFKNFIIEYNSEKQEKARQALVGLDVRLWPGMIKSTTGPLVREPVVWAVTTAVVLGWLSVRTYRRRESKTGRRPVITIYDRLLAIMERQFRLTPKSSQTPGEFAEAAQARLHESEFADLPSRVVALFYRIRYGAQAADSAELSEMNELLSRLEARRLQPAG